MVFLIQNTQNRDAEAMQIKLDELIRAVQGAQNELLDLEELDERELDRIRSKYEELAGRRGAGSKRRRRAMAEKRPHERSQNMAVKIVHKIFPSAMTATTDAMPHGARVTAG